MTENNKLIKYGLISWPRKKYFTLPPAPKKHQQAVSKHVDYESSVINSSQDNEGNPFVYKNDPFDLELPFHQFNSTYYSCCLVPVWRL